MTSQNDPFLTPGDRSATPPEAPVGQPAYAPLPDLATAPPPGLATTPPDAYAPAPLSAPGYAASAPYPYQPAPYGGYPRPDAKNWMGIVALVGGIVGFFMGPLISIPAIVFGHLGRSAARKGEATNGGLALGGLVTAYISAAMWILGFIAYWVFVVVMISSGY